MDHRNRRLSMEPLEDRCMLSAGAEFDAIVPVPEDIAALQGRQIAAIEATLDAQFQPAQISPLLSQNFEGGDTAFNGSRAIDLGYVPEYNLQDFTIHAKALYTEKGVEQVIVGLNTQANRSYGYSGVTLNFSREGGMLKIWYAAPDTNHEVFTHFTPEIGREYDIVVAKQGKQLQLFVDGEHREDLTCPAAEIMYNATGRTMVSGLWSGDKGSAIYQLNGEISELRVYGAAYAPAELQQEVWKTTVEDAPLAEESTAATIAQEAQPACIPPLLSQTFEGSNSAFNGSRAVDLGYVPEYNLQDFTIRTTVVAGGSAAEQVIVGLNTQANRSYGYSGVTLNFSREGGMLKIWYAAPDTNHEVFTHFTPEIGRAYDITLSKQGKQLRLFVDGEHREDLTCPAAEIMYNATGRTMVSGLWSGDKGSAIYQLNGEISELKMYGAAYAPAELDVQKDSRQEAVGVPTGSADAAPMAAQGELQQAEAAPSYAPRMLLTVSGGGFDARFRSPYDVTCFQVFAVRNKATGDKWCIGEETVSHPGGQPDGGWGWSSDWALLRNPEIKDIEVVMWCGAKGDKVADRAVGSISYGKLSLHTPQSAWEDILAEQRIESAVQPELNVLKIEGPNVLVHIASPANQSTVNIGGNGLLATRTQLHEGGTASAILQVTMNAGNPRGAYAIQLMNVPNGLVLDSVPVYWDGSSLSLLHAEDGMEGMPVEWDIPQEYCMSSALVRSNMESDLAARSGLLISPAAAEASFYERHPEYRPENLQATINAEHARLPSFTRSQTADRVLGDMYDLLTRMHRGLDALNSAIQNIVLPAAMNVFRGVLSGVPESQLHAQLDAAMRCLVGGRITDLYLHTKIAAPSRSAILAAAQQVFFEETDLMEYYRAQDQKLLAKGVAPQTEDPFITAARQRGELWAQYMGQISAGQMTAAQALTALAADVSSTSVAQAQQQAVDQVMALVAEDPALLANADDLLTLAEVEVGGVETGDAVLTVSQAQIPLGGTVEVNWGFSRIYGADVARVSLYLVDRSASGSAQEIMVLEDQCLSDGSYAFDTSKRISQAGEYRILAVATLANGRLVGGQAEVRVGVGENNEVIVPETWDEVTNRRIQELHPAIREMTLTFINRVEEELNIRLRITQNPYRSFGEQNALYAAGISPVRGGESYHNYGLAIDLVEIEANGAANFQTNWDAIARIGKDIGFNWSGDWDNPYEKGHFDVNFDLRTDQLLQLYKERQEGQEYVSLPTE
ncbi:MAG: M15 family metallopeptidase [Candidatus Peribacteraceae bacterium]|nr:M15 family metallopeptidase [Candidatus Peribacteraceae bacterium]